MLAKSAIEAVSKYLSDYEADYEYTHWPETELLAHLGLALDIVASHNKLLFSVKTRVALSPGAIQHIPPPCQGVVDTLFSNQDGGLIHFTGIRTNGLDFPSACEESLPYRVRSIYLSPASPSVLSVMPPVPVGISSYIYVHCYIPPVISGFNDVVTLPSGLMSALFELQLYYAFGIDIESSASKERSGVHWQNAMLILQPPLSSMPSPPAQ
jgi:hypothetical protein